MVRFVHVQDNEEDSEHSDNFDNFHVRSNCVKPKASNSSCQITGVSTSVVKSQFPASISIGELLRAGKLVAPASKKTVSLALEHFDITNQEWSEVRTLNTSVYTNKFASGGFRDAFKCVETGPNGEIKYWVLKLYNANARNTIINQLSMTMVDHARKQVQMHEVAKHFAKKMSKKVPGTFGNTFFYNKVYYTKFEDQHATIEEYINGYFVKYVNNNGHCVLPPESSTQDEKVIYEKAETLVHYSYALSEGKMMLIDIQGSGYALCDPEIATESLKDDDDNDNSEILFCCGNLSTMAIQGFLNEHSCNKYCKMLALSDNADDSK
jgi:hypothetical protein